jgi:putative membrane protein
MLWVKAFHIIAVVTWFSGLFYLPRLFVYHVMSDDEISRERFVIMERKLFWGITTPSAVVTVVLGAWLLVANWSYFMVWWWMHAKLTLVALLLIYHGFCWWYMKLLRERRNQRSHVFYRVFNEMPVAILVAVVILIVVKPTL